MSQKETSYQDALDSYAEIKEAYELFKRLRKELGIPLRPFIPKKKDALEDLSSGSFSQLIEEAKKKEKRRKLSCQERSLQ